MYFYHSKLHFIVILMMLAVSNACASQAYYGPVQIDDKGFSEEKQSVIIIEQGLNKGNQVVTRDMRKDSVATTRRTGFLGLSSGHGYQRLVHWNQKWPLFNIKVGNKTRRPHADSEDRIADKKQQNEAAKNVSTQQKKTINSIPDKTIDEDRNGYKKQQTKHDIAKKSKKQQQKSIVSIDNKKMLELNFGWPIKGRVLKRFSPSRNKGIDIAGKKGQSVKATETGKVVYGGQGLIGFGKFLIIKHNDVYLSAYANNSRLLVKEGQHVEKGQVIAEVGDVGIKRTSLHFEIRKNGRPVNPLKLLPKK